MPLSFWKGLRREKGCRTDSNVRTSANSCPSSRRGVCARPVGFWPFRRLMRLSLQLGGRSSFWMRFRGWEPTIPISPGFSRSLGIGFSPSASGWSLSCVVRFRHGLRRTFSTARDLSGGIRLTWSWVSFRSQRAWSCSGRWDGTCRSTSGSTSCPSRGVSSGVSSGVFGRGECAADVLYAQRIALPGVRRDV